VARANLLALENPAAENGTFNVGTGERLTVVALAKMIRHKLESSVELSFAQQFRIGDIRDCYADLTRSREVLGYQPKIPFEEGVGELIDWARGEEVEDRLSEAEAELEKHKLA